MNHALGTWIVAIGLACPAAGATLHGALRYAGRPSAEALPSFTYGRVAVQKTGGDWQYFEIATATSSWSATGLAPGTYTVQLALAAAPIGFPSPRVGYAFARASNVSLAEGEDKTVDLDLFSCVHVTLPFDNSGTWPGSVTECPYGPTAPQTFTLAWDAVPQAVSYRVIVRRWSCGGWIANTDIDTTATAVSITQHTVAGEDFLLLEVNAFDGDHRLLSQMPYVQYLGASSTAHYVHLAGGEGRAVHQPASRFLAQVAHVGGAQGSFWRSDVTLANRTTEPVEAKLYFTPRGANGREQYQSATVSLPANACRTIPDIVDTLFHTTGAGSLEVAATGVTVSSRCATAASGGGQYGQGFPPIDPASVATAAGPVRRLGVGGVARGAYRSNLALVEIWGEAATVRVALHDRDGQQVGSREYELLPLSNVQINDVVATLGGPTTMSEGVVTVEALSGEGKVGAQLSLVDNGSNDPCTVPLAPW